MAAAGVRAELIIPETIPDPLIPGFRFPESEATLTRWITEMSRGEPATTSPTAAEKLYLHGWGLWAALAQDTMQVHQGQRLRVFETWLTPGDLTATSGMRTVAALAQLPRNRAPLRELTGLGGQAPARPSRRVRSLRASEFEREPAAEASAPDAAVSSVDRVIGFVKYDPTAADHILRQELLSTSALNALLRGGAQQIPPFPATSLVVKPLFQFIKAGDLIEGRYGALKAWSGPPETPQAYPPTRWPGVVWFDVLDGGRGRGAIDSPFAADGSTRTNETTYPISNVIHYRLSAADAAALNADKPGTNAQAGDYALLVAMHVASREIARWTWQTFWWTPNPDDPPAPSSRLIADRRPDQLRGAARNYAMAQTYTMLIPDPPYAGGGNVGAAVYAYNPWFEARFGPADLPDSIPGSDPNGRPADNNHGIQSNCMSCHAQATFNPRGFPTAPRFAGARYVDLTDPQYLGTLQVDFLWSIARHAK